jgi:hypothetical protein
VADFHFGCSSAPLPPLASRDLRRDCHDERDKLGELQAEVDALQEEVAALLHVPPGGGGGGGGGGRGGGGRGGDDDWGEERPQRLRMGTEEALKKEIEALKRLLDRLRLRGDGDGTGDERRPFGESKAGGVGATGGFIVSYSSAPLTSSSTLSAKAKELLASQVGVQAHDRAVAVGTRPCAAGGERRRQRKKDRRENWPGPLLRMRRTSQWEGQAGGRSLYPSLRKTTLQRVEDAYPFLVDTPTPDLASRSSPAPVPRLYDRVCGGRKTVSGVRPRPASVLALARVADSEPVLEHGAGAQKRNGVGQSGMWALENSGVQEETCARGEGHVGLAPVKAKEEGEELAGADMSGGTHGKKVVLAKNKSGKAMRVSYSVGGGGGRKETLPMSQVVSVCVCVREREGRRESV